MWFTKTLKTDQNAGLTSSTVNPVTRITVGKVHFCKTKAKKKHKTISFGLRKKKVFWLPQARLEMSRGLVKKTTGSVTRNTAGNCPKNDPVVSHLSSTFSYESHTINMYWECVMTDIAHFPWRLSCPQLWGPDSKGLGLPCFLTSI